jgi:hypothetical protein
MPTGLPFLDLGFERLFQVSHASIKPPPIALYLSTNHQNTITPKKQCLDVGHVLTVLALLLLERKVLVVARHESLLTEVMEAFRALLFPFKWESCYVSA